MGRTSTSACLSVGSCEARTRLSTAGRSAVLDRVRGMPMSIFRIWCIANAPEKRNSRELTPRNSVIICVIICPSPQSSQNIPVRLYTFVKRERASRPVITPTSRNPILNEESAVTCPMLAAYCLLLTMRLAFFSAFMSASLIHLRSDYLCYRPRRRNSVVKSGSRA